MTPDTGSDLVGVRDVKALALERLLPGDALRELLARTPDKVPRRELPTLVETWLALSKIGAARGAK